MAARKAAPITLRPHKARKPGHAAASRKTTRIAQATNPASARTLLIDHTRLVKRLLALPDPEPSAITDTLAAADLLAVADGTRGDFGRAAAGVPEQIGFTRQALAIDDDTFRVAHQVIGHPYAEEQRPEQASQDGNEAARALMEDHVLGTEFYLQLFSLLMEAPAEISYESGEEIF